MHRELKARVPPSEAGYKLLQHLLLGANPEEWPTIKTVVTAAKDGSVVPLTELATQRPEVFHIYFTAQGRKKRDGIDIAAREDHWLIIYSDENKENEVCAKEMAKLLQTT